MITILLNHHFYCFSFVFEQVTFHPRIMTRCLTLDGDSVDPEGTLSGGARQEGPALLDTIAEIKKLRAAFRPKEQEMEAIKDQIILISQVGKTYNKGKEEVDTLQIELETVKQRLAQTSFQKHQQEIEDTKTEIS